MYKALLIEDDPSYCKLLSALAPDYGISVESRNSFRNMGALNEVTRFDFVIFDHYLDGLTGKDLAGYVDQFFSDIPIILISSESELLSSISPLPESIVQFIPKSRGARFILESANRMLLRRQYLKKLQSDYSSRGSL